MLKFKRTLHQILHFLLVFPTRSTVICESYIVPTPKYYYMCEVISDSDKFCSTVAGESFKSNHQRSCNDKCLVYLAICKILNNQYTGQTTGSFRSM